MAAREVHDLAYVEDHFRHATGIKIIDGLVSSMRSFGLEPMQGCKMLQDAARCCKIASPLFSQTSILKHR